MGAIFWIFTLLVVKNYYSIVEVENKINHYRLNILMNLIYPVTEKFYNDNFIMFYNIDNTNFLGSCYIDF